MKINPFIPFSNSSRGVTTEDLRYVHQTYGINRFFICGPSKSLRISGYPGMNYYEEIARRINELQKDYFDPKLEIILRTGNSVCNGTREEFVEFRIPFK